MPSSREERTKQFIKCWNCSKTAIGGPAPHDDRIEARALYVALGGDPLRSLCERSSAPLQIIFDLKNAYLCSLLSAKFFLYDQKVSIYPYTWDAPVADGGRVIIRSKPFIAGDMT